MPKRTINAQDPTADFSASCSSNSNSFENTSDIGPLNVFAFESRIKTCGPGVAKAQRLNVDVPDRYDLAGMRVVVRSRAEVDVVKRFFTLKPFL